MKNLEKLVKKMEGGEQIKHTCDLSKGQILEAIDMLCEEYYCTQVEILSYLVEMEHIIGGHIKKGGDVILEAGSRDNWSTCKFRMESE